MKKVKILLLILLLFAAVGCEDFEKIHNYNGHSYTLLNQDSVQVKFPDFLNGKISVVGYIFTNCPDICPLTTNNMRIIKRDAEKAGITDVQYVTISFDPEVDRPSVLKKYSELRSIDFDNWYYLTGDKVNIDPLMRSAGIVAVPGDSTITPAGDKIIYYVHTDRISLVDENGYVRKNYKGSTIDYKEILADIKKLGDY